MKEDRFCQPKTEKTGPAASEVHPQSADYVKPQMNADKTCIVKLHRYKVSFLSKSIDYAYRTKNCAWQKKTDFFPNGQTPQMQEKKPVFFRSFFLGLTQIVFLCYGTILLY